jgi:hypothetical protein
MTTLAVWWAMRSDESTLKDHFKPLALPGTTEWFCCDEEMRRWLRFMRKQHFVAHNKAELGEAPYVDSSRWLPSSDVAKQARGNGQLRLSFELPEVWGDIVEPFDHIGDGDFYSPPALLTAARSVLGDIDLDPASCREANREVQAKQYYSWREDGLAHEWAGRMWINPPFPWEPWVEKFVSEWDAGKIVAAIILCETRVTTALYFHPMIERCSAVLKMKGRLRFWGPKAGTPDEGHELYYFGSSVSAFSTEYQMFGRVFAPAKRMPAPEPEAPPPS